MTPMELKLELERLAEKATPGAETVSDGLQFSKDGIGAYELFCKMRNNLPTILRALSALSGLEGVKGALEELLVAVEYGGVADLNSNPDNPGYTPRIPIAFVTSARSAIAQLQKVMG